ncbi:MAG TPA: sigma-70 family RNA polymerase sigma factor [Methylomirabilota bacterium]|nr:sigma-70 family RNA polymerase sigma factor [Methylomirabilota bacterium]
MEHSDERLMLEFSQGRPEAFGELFRRYRTPICGFFRRRVTDPARAEELAQDTFLAVVRGAARYQPKALFRTYLYAIGLNILRKERRKATIRGFILGGQTEAANPAARDTSEAGLLLRESLGKLDAMDREVLMLREYEQLRYAEIADVLGIPVNTVRSRLFRARLALRDLLQAKAPQRAAQIEART